MAAEIRRFASKAELLKRDKAALLRQLALDFEPEAPRAVSQIVAAIDRNTAAERGWSFVMLSPMQNAAVVQWIDANAKRPRVSMRLWAEFFCHLRRDTGEIVMTRAEMMEACGAASSHVSEALSELHRIGALIRHQEGREVRWFMNSQVATCLTGAAREEAQRSDPPLRLVPGGAGR